MAKKSMTERAWDTYASYLESATTRRDVDISATRARLAASGVTMTDINIEALTKNIHEAYDKEMEDFREKYGPVAWETLQDEYAFQERAASEHLTDAETKLSGLRERLETARDRYKYEQEGRERTSLEATISQLEQQVGPLEALVESRTTEYDIFFGDMETYFGQRYGDEDLDVPVYAQNYQSELGGRDSGRESGGGRPNPADPFGSGSSFGFDTAPQYESIGADYDRPR